MVGRKATKSILILVLLTLLAFLANLLFGSVSIPPEDVIYSLTGQELERDSWNYIIQNYRLPKALTAVIVGAGLGISGLLMQTLFRNPLAGPFVLGISSGASLGVAVFIMGSGLISGFLAALAVSKWGIIIASSLGSFLVLLAVVIVSARIRDTMAILIIGLMFASLTSAVVGILSYFASAEQLQQYIFWGFGSLGNLSWNEVSILSLVFLMGVILSIYSLKSLDALLLGEHYAKSMGMNVRKNRFVIILATSLLAGGITAFAGPIAFVGLAIPHIARQILSSAGHKLLLPAVVLIGAIVMLVCDSIAQLPGSDYTLPVNAVTALMGAPVVIWLLVRKKNMIF